MVHSFLVMKRLKIFIIGLISITFLGTSAWFLVNYLEPKEGGVQIDSTPASRVYINDKFVGKTPYEAIHPQGELAIRLISEETDKTHVPFELKVFITPKVKTVIRHEFGEKEEIDSSFVVSFEEGIKNETTLTVISTPDNAQILIDGIVRGFTPFKINKLTSGEHNITLKSVGYKDKELLVNLVPGYRLSLVADLGKDEVSIEPEVASVQTEIITFVEIGDTPTGFLRVRTQPGSGGSEIYQVKPGEKYLFLEEDTVTGWYKIQVQDPSPGLPDGIVGWVSNQYSKKVEK